MVYLNTYWHSKFRVFAYPGINARPLNSFSAFLLGTLSPIFRKSLFEKPVLIFIRKDEKCRSSHKMHCCSDLNHVQAKKQKCFKKNAKMRRIAFCSETFFAKFFILLNSLILHASAYFHHLFFATFYKIWLLFTNFFFAFWLRKMYSKFGKHGKISTQSKRNNILIRF